MKPYLRERQAHEKFAKTLGIVLAAVLHVAAAILLVFTGVKYLYPPPEEQTFIIDFEQEEPQVLVQHRNGTVPQAEEIDLTKPVELVQRSESPETIAKNNLTPQTKQDNFGDVETPSPKPKQEPELDPRASFPGMAKKDTSLTAPHSASEASSNFKDGQPKGNTDVGKTAGTANAHVKGRSLKGSLPLPKYNVQNEGIVVVDIWVDPYGNVVDAKPGAQGTTVTDQRLWAAARAAALKAVFNMSTEAGAKQQGTITYIFKLK